MTAYTITYTYPTRDGCTPRLKLGYHFFNSQKIPQIKTSCQKKHWKCNMHRPGLLNQSMSSPSIEHRPGNSIIQNTIPYLRLDQYSSEISSWFIRVWIYRPTSSQPITSAVATTSSPLVSHRWTSDTRSKTIFFRRNMLRLYLLFMEFSRLLLNPTLIHTSSISWCFSYAKNKSICDTLSSHVFYGLLVSVHA